MSFNFISDEQFRACLENDYREMQKALARQMWKAAHVLAGSILEAVLCDFLIVTEYQKRTKTDPTTLDLSKVVEACYAEGALSSKARNLASAVREYRNLIHPGRAIRLEEEVSESSAKVVEAVLEIAIAEVTKKKKKVCGYNAEQIVRKLEVDPAAVGLLSHLLGGIRPYELERLLLFVIPQRYEAESLRPTSLHLKAALLACFHFAFDVAAEETKKKVALDGAKLVREHSEAIVVAYQDAFFRARHLQLLPDKDRELVKARLMLRLKKEKTEQLFQSVQGLEKYLSEKELLTYLDFLMRCSFWGTEDTLKKAAEKAILSLNSAVSEEQQLAIWERLSIWEKHFQEHDAPELAKRVGSFHLQMMAGAFFGQFAETLTRRKRNNSSV
jgi:hypothetical protein